MSNGSDFFSDRVRDIEKRKLESRQGRKRSVWMGFGVMGIVGWSVALPTILGVVAGVWLDKRFPQSFSWTLTCMIGGLMLGCMVAYQWLNEEDRDINKK